MDNFIDIPGTTLSCPRWLLMWSVAFGMFFVVKWISWRNRNSGKATVFRHIAYGVGWVGMDADAFIHRPARSTAGMGNWLFGVGKLALGFVILIVMTPCADRCHALFGGWTAMIGIVLILHFGVFHLLANFWRWVGYDAVPIMNWPILSRSLTEFWGRRWNLAFRDLTHRYLFSPLVKRLGAKRSFFLGFLVSGIVHDLVISLPAGGGWGLPTLYFVIQGVGIAIERSLCKPIAGRVFTACVLILPSPLLFHQPFIDRVIVPFVVTLGVLP